MDFEHCDQYNHLLTRKCSCGGDAEMLVDFVGDFEARCSKCHRSTHAYIEPEDAAKHWNDGDDIMDTPLHIFWDDPEGYLQGEVVAIHIDDSLTPITAQSVDFRAAVIEYTDKMLFVEHNDDRPIDIGEISSFHPDCYRHTILPANGETIRFENIVFSEDGKIVRLEYRWKDTWLFICVEPHTLVIARDIVPYDAESPSMDGDYPLNWT